MTQALVAAILALTAVLALYRRVPLVSTLGEGAREGLQTVLGIFPSLLVILTGVQMLRASGALEALAALLSPLLLRLGIPPETVPLLLIRPLSGSAALAFGADLFQSCGADSFAGRVTAVLLGSTETTFYVTAVYFGAVGVKRSGYAIPAALAADLAAFLLAGPVVRLLFPS